MNCSTDYRIKLITVQNNCEPKFHSTNFLAYQQEQVKQTERASECVCDCVYCIYLCVRACTNAAVYVNMGMFNTSNNENTTKATYREHMYWKRNKHEYCY
jgi:hypothetical protein